MHSQFEPEATLSPLHPPPCHWQGFPQWEQEDLIRIEDYLDHLCAPLVGKLSYPERAEFRQEVRTHLLSLATAHQELGSTPSEAITAALRQFGRAQQVADSLVSERRTHRTLRPLQAKCLHALFSSLVGSGLFVAYDLWGVATHQWNISMPQADITAGTLIGTFLSLLLQKKHLSIGRVALAGAGIYVATVISVLLCSGVLTTAYGEAILRMTTQIALLGGLHGVISSLLQRKTERLTKTEPTALRT